MVAALFCYVLKKDAEASQISMNLTTFVIIGPINLNEEQNSLVARNRCFPAVTPRGIHV